MDYADAADPAPDSIPLAVKLCTHYNIAFLLQHVDKALIATNVSLNKFQPQQIRTGGHLMH